MKRFIILIITFAISLTAYTQNNIDTDQGATAIMQNMSKQYNNYNTLGLNFTIKITKEKQTLNSFIGTLTLKKEKYMVHLPDQQMYCDGTNLWSYQKESNEVSIFSFEVGDEPIYHPKILINWQEKFKAQYIREAIENNKILHVIDLLTLSAQPYYKIRVYINKKNAQIVRFEIFDKNNTITSISIDKTTINQPVEDNKFIFNPQLYPNISINDMR